MDAREAFDDPQIIALAEAAARGDAARVRELVAQGAGINARGDRGVNLLEWAMGSKSTEGLKALLEVGADPANPGIGDSTAIHTAAMANDPIYLEILLAHGADPNTPETRTGDPPLSVAVGYDNDPQFRMLLAAGADPNRSGGFGETPLHMAASAGTGEQVLALLEAGADPLARNAQDCTFQCYFFKTRWDLLNEEARHAREAVVQWLKAHAIPLEEDPYD
ncbi:MAG: ankyrin repeat domain-containing protein [Thermoanaerobaculia bacterium]